MNCMKKFEIVLAICFVLLLGTVCFADTQVLKLIEIETEQPVEGEIYTDTFKVKTNLSGKFEKSVY